VKKHTKTITIIIILVLALLMFASFFGVYKKNENGEKVNLLPNLKLGMEFGKTRTITANVSEQTTKTIYDAEGNIITPEDGVEYTEEAGYKTVETPVNDASIKTLENYRKTKDIIEKRLEGNNIADFNIELDEKTGQIKLQIPENESADEIEYLIKNTGSLILLDNETFEVVFDNSYFDKAEVMRSQGDIETGIFLQLSFNEEGTKRINELADIYKTTTEEQTDETGETKQVEKSKSVWVILNDSFLGATVLPNIVYDGKIILTFAASSDTKELNEAVKSASQQAVLLNSGTTPLQYEYSDEVVETNITTQSILLYLSAIGMVFLLAYAYLIIKFKAKGFISIYFQVGYLAVLLLLLRLTSVTITMEGMAAIIISLILDYIFTYITLTNLNTEVEGMYKKSNLQFLFNSLPIYIIALVFTYGKLTYINSFGMTLFWGIIMVYLYNYVFTKFIYENLSEK
jgi:flagellar basal body-associated protein FliL